MSNEKNPSKRSLMDNKLNSVTLARPHVLGRQQTRELCVWLNAIQVEWKRERDLEECG